MGTFFKYLLSLAVHAAWMRAGKGGPVPAVRLPGKKDAMPLPVIGPWQMLVFTWLARKLWQQYGDQVRARVAQVDHPAAQRVHDWMPSTGKTTSKATGGSRATSAPPTTFVVPPGSPAPAGAKTQHLPPQTPGGKPTTGSLFSRLRKGA